MAETQLAKRHREQEEEKEQDNPSTKHHKPYNKDDNQQQQQQQPQENQNDQNPSSLLMITTPLHQEHEPASLANQQQPVVDVGDDKDRDQSLRSVLRHLLEASDDELGIPNNSNHNNSIDHEADHQVLNPSCSAAAGADSAVDFGEYELWEIEDEAANYYTVLQSQLFM